MNPILITPKNEAEVELITSILSRMNIEFTVVQNNLSEDILVERIKVAVAEEFSKSIFAKRKHKKTLFDSMNSFSSLFDDNDNENKRN